ncbi:mitotic spindle assembly checkpoint protein MAD1-like protein [Euroglyphus maynei]|uniref:Mitotic spindle assembly checkpoint protein MAD1-like protein n=1 Tax=Euroglyphus maynei TaxID=6958 RepID=A0A1Y3BCX1_EURMA|nr:mitotic spindle assembly checkpoint protein MAD1-like protein [Euroglyphus maynei]
MMMSTGIKRPRPNDSHIPTSISKFKRSTPLSLMKPKITRHDMMMDDSNAPDLKLDFRSPIPIDRSVSTMSFGSRLSNIQKSDVNNSKISSNSSLFEEPTFITRNVESKATSPIVDWKTITKDSEIISYKVRINVLQKELDELQCKNSKLRIDNEVNATRYQNEIDEYKNRTKELQNEIQTLKENEKKLKYEFDEFQKLHLEQSKMMDKQNVEHEKLLANLNEELFKARSYGETQRSQLSMDALNFEHRISLLQSENEQLRQENQLHRSNALDFDEKQKEIETLTLKLNELNSVVEKLRAELKSYEEGKKLESILRGELNQLQSVKDENVQLRNKLDLLSRVHEKNVMLEEKSLGLKMQIEILEKQLEKKNIDIHELEMNKQKLLKWTQLVGIDSPEIVADKIRKLEETISLLNVENDLQKSKMKTLEEKISNENFLSKSNELNVKNAEAKIVELRERLECLNKKCQFLTKEVDYYKKIATQDSYSVNNNGQQRIAELETIIEQYKTAANKFETELNETRKQLDTHRTMDRENEELKNELQRIKELNPHICTNLSMLDCSTLQTNEKQYRVLHMVENPVSWETKKRIEEWKNLAEENERLKCLVEILERGETNQADITRQIDEGLQYRFQVKNLEEQLARNKQKMNKFEEIFRKKCDNFRKCCMEVTGYQIDNPNGNRYRLRHKYAFKNEFYIEFDGKKIKLLKDEITERLSDKIDLYINEHNSFPAFFASYTLELFKEQTMI